MEQGDLRLRVRPELDDPALVLALEGWNDAGEAASSALRHLAESVQAVSLGEIDGESYYDYTVQRPQVTAPDGAVRQIEWPAVRFSYASLEGVCDLILGVGPEPHMRWRAFTEAMMAGIASLGVKRVVLLGAYLADVVYTLPVQVTGLASETRRLAELGIPASRYEGPTGMLGVLADRCAREGLEVVSLWAGLPHYISVSPNPRGALALTQKLSESLALPIDDGALRHAAAEYEVHTSEIVANDPELSDYVRELKRRSFAQ